MIAVFILDIFALLTKNSHWELSGELGIWINCPKILLERSCSTSLLKKKTGNFVRFWTNCSYWIRKTNVKFFELFSDGNVSNILEIKSYFVIIKHCSFQRIRKLHSSNFGFDIPQSTMYNRIHYIHIHHLIDTHRIPWITYNLDFS